MSNTASDLDLNQQLKNKVISSAASSLSMFTLKFNDGTGLLLKATANAGSALIENTLVPANDLPQISEAVCKVDWTWIEESKVESVQLVPGTIKLNLQPAGPLNIQCQFWQGSPFLAFMPYRAAK